MEGYVAALLFGSAAFTVPRASRDGVLHQLSLWTLYLAAALSFVILLSAVGLRAWLSAIWCTGLLGGSLGVLGKQQARVEWRRALAFGAIALGLTAVVVCLGVWTTFGARAATVLELHYRSGLGWVLFGDLSLGLTASAIGWSCLSTRGR